jgi:osmoprotectant transport system permease protein
MTSGTRVPAILSLVVVIALLGSRHCQADPQVKVGSKVFTESVILGEIATQLGNARGVDTVYLSPLGGTRILWEALLTGRIDAYPEYTGTIAQELLPGTPPTIESLRTALAKKGLGITDSLGFNDTYALGVPEALAERLSLRSIGDLAAHPELRFAFSNEFLDRADGWPAVRSSYDLQQAQVTGMDHDLAYKAVSLGSVDVIDLYTTDAEILSYHLRVLEDDKHVFPPYQAVFLYRLDLKEKAPAFIDALERLAQTIDLKTMMEMNAASKLHHVPETRIASSFLQDHLGIFTHVSDQSWRQLLVTRTREHLTLVAVSLAASIAVAIPLGVVAFAWPRLGWVILTSVSVIYTIPSLALLVLMIPILGIGAWPAIAALFLYSLLPIVRNTHAGLAGIAPGLRESAIVLGLPPSARLMRIEIPLAAPSILAGIKTAAVINVGTATLGALIGAGGYGQPILTGIRLADNHLILLGAIPSALLALMVQGAFSLLERAAIPRGLRLKIRS